MKLFYILTFFLAVSGEEEAAFNTTDLSSERLFDSNQYVECFTNYNVQGGSIKITYAINDLYKMGWDNAFASCCFNGFWFLYEDPDFNKYNENV